MSSAPITLSASRRGEAITTSTMSRFAMHDGRRSALGRSPCAVCEAEAVTTIGTCDDYCIVRCQSCNHLYADPMPDPATLAAFYRDYFKTRQYADKLQSKIRRARKRIRHVRRRHNPGKRFLDVGCNVGFAAEAAALVGFEALGIDIDRVAVTQAQARFPCPDFRVASVEEIAQTGERFDFVYCSEVIEHVSDVRRFTRALATLVDPGGVVFLTTPDAGHRSVRSDYFAGDFIRPPEHLHYFDRNSISRLLEQSGFDRVSFPFSAKTTLKVIATRS